MRAVIYYFERDIVKWLRGRVSVISSLVMPAAWLVFVGLALPTKFTDNYIQFITPGILVMTTLFSSLQGGTLIIFDKILGFLNKFLALPSPRESMLYGKILFISVRGLLQATVILLIATLLGVRIFNPVNVILIYLTLFLFSVFFSALSTMIGLYLGDHDGYSAVNSMISMPLLQRECGGSRIPRPLQAVRQLLLVINENLRFQFKGLKPEFINGMISENTHLLFREIFIIFLI